MFKIYIIYKLYFNDYKEGLLLDGKIGEDFGEVERIWKSIWEFLERGKVFILEFRKVCYFKLKICRKIVFIY